MPNGNKNIFSLINIEPSKTENNFYQNYSEYLGKTYFYELERKDRIYSNIRIPMTIIFALIAAFLYLLQEYKFEYDLLVPFFVSEFCLLLSILFSIFFVVKSMYNKQYGYIPKTDELTNYVKELTKYYNDIRAEHIDDKVEEDLHKLLIEEYSQQGAINTVTNRQRLRALFWTHTCIIVAFVCLMSAFFPFARYHAIQAYQTWTKNLTMEGTAMQKDKKPPAPPPEKPKPPKGRVVTEGLEKPKKIK